MEKAKRYTYGYKNDAARLHVGYKQSVITIPVYVCKKINDRWSILGIDTDIVTLSVDDKIIDIIPAKESSDETYALCYNGTGSGRKVTLPMYLVEKYGFYDGYFRTEVLKNGTLRVKLTERLK